MNDEGLLKLKRRWRASGLTGDEEHYLRELRRRGELDDDRLSLAAFAGHPAARSLLLDEAPDLPRDFALWPAEWQTWAGELLHSELDIGEGRIWFPGNPWPNGHLVRKVLWSGVLDDDGLHFRFSATTMDYDFEDTDDEPEDEDDELDDWQATGVWGNYHRCRMSGGFPIAPLSEPFHQSSFKARVDTEPEALIDDDDFAFETYLLGHDSVGDHSLHLTPNRDGTHRLIWSGKIALTYRGDDNFRYRFWLEEPRVRFDGFQISQDETSALRDLSTLVANPDDYEVIERNGSSVLIPKFLNSEAP